MLLHADYPSSWRLTSAGTWEYSMGHSPSGCILNKDFMIKHVNFFLIETWRRVPTCLFILHVPVMAGPEVSQARAVQPRSQSRSPCGWQRHHLLPARVHSCRQLDVRIQPGQGPGPSRRLRVSQPLVLAPCQRPVPK